MKISIIIPCYNEYEYIDKVINNILSKNPQFDLEIIIIDDASTDGSSKKIKKLFDEKKIHKYFKNIINQGKGSCIQKGIKSSSGEIVLIQDADLEYDPGEYAKLLSPIFKHNADVVYGSRFLGSDNRRVLYFWHRVANYILTMLSNIFSNLNFTDMEVCYKAFKKQIFENISLKEKRFGFEPEITAKIAKNKKLKIYEVGISYYGRTYQEGKKINWRDGFSALRCILYYNIFDS